MISYFELLKQRNDAYGELDASVSSFSALADQLREGVTYQQAIEIVNQFWRPRDAGVMKTRLFTSFPKKNGELILQSDLDNKIRDRMTTVITREYFKNAHAYIEDRIEKYLAIFKKLETSDKSSYGVYLDFRKQVARYLGGVDYGVYDLKPELLNGGVKVWGDLKCDESAIESGDYMLWDDLPLMIKEAHQTFTHNHLDRKEHINLNNLSWCFDNVRAHMEFCVLFAGWLQLPEE